LEQAESPTRNKKIILATSKNSFLDKKTGKALLSFSGFIVLSGSKFYFCPVYSKFTLTLTNKFASSLIKLI
jgi:hypothetical protein